MIERLSTYNKTEFYIDKGIYITECKQKDINELSKFAISNISKITIYSKKAREDYKKEFFPQEIRKGLKDNEIIFLLKDKNGKIIGFNNYLTEETGVCWLDWIIIDSFYRGRGVATVLLSFALKEIRKKGMHAVWLDSRTDNKASVRLFEKNNFHRVKMKNWFFNQDYYIWFKQI